MFSQAFLAAGLLANPQVEPIDQFPQLVLRAPVPRVVESESVITDRRTLTWAAVARIEPALLNLVGELGALRSDAMPEVRRERIANELARIEGICKIIGDVECTATGGKIGATNLPLKGLDVSLSKLKTSLNKNGDPETLRDECFELWKIVAKVVRHSSLSPTGHRSVSADAEAKLAAFILPGTGSRAMELGGFASTLDKSKDTFDERQARLLSKIALERETLALLARRSELLPGRSSAARTEHLKALDDFYAAFQKCVRDDGDGQRFLKAVDLVKIWEESERLLPQSP